jgi:hypothetical protein
MITFTNKLTPRESDRASHIIRHAGTVTKFTARLDEFGVSRSSFGRWSDVMRFLDMVAIRLGRLDDTTFQISRTEEDVDENPEIVAYVDKVVVEHPTFL